MHDSVFTNDIHGETVHIDPGILVHFSTTRQSKPEATAAYGLVSTFDVYPHPLLILTRCLSAPVIDSCQPPPNSHSRENCVPPGGRAALFGASPYHLEAARAMLYAQR